MPRISAKNAITLPAEVLASAGLRAGDEVSVEARAPGVITIRRVFRRPEDAFGVFDGLYERGHLADLRRGERC